MAIVFANLAIAWHDAPRHDLAKQRVDWTVG
jgi:hypothetical protein